MASCPSCKRRFPDNVRICDQDGTVLLPDKAVDSSDPDLEPGTMVGEYLIEDKLGKGGFGTVYRAVHPLIGKKAAVKVLSRACSTNPEMVSRFIAEARSVNTIEHDNIIDIFSFGTLESDRRHYFVMELLEGLSFDRYLAAGGPLEPALLLHIMSGVSQALAAAHGKSIVHRDLKPDNVFIAVDSGGRPLPKLLDFGIAKLLGDTTSGHRTHAGVPVGTPQYMSPEQCAGESPDHRADIYSFGIMCFEALAGKLPFEGTSLLSLMTQHTGAARPPVSSVRPQLGSCFDAPVRAMMAIDPQDRPQTITTAWELLRDAAVGAGADPDGEVKLDLDRVSRGMASAKERVPRGATPEEIAVADTVADSGAADSPEPAAPELSQDPPRGRKSSVIARKTYRGVPYLFIDYRGLEAQDHLAALDEVIEFARTTAETDLLVLTDVRHATVTRQVVKRLRELSPIFSPKVKASAIVGVTGIGKVTLSAMNLLARKSAGWSVKPFDDHNAALDWLIRQR